MTNRTRSATLLGAACLVAVAGCGSDPKPKVLPSLSSTPSTTATSTTSPGSVEAEVEAAVRHYYDAVNDALVAGNTGQLRTLSLPECGCRALVKSIEDSFANGRLKGASFRVLAIRIHDIRARTAGAEVTFEVSAYSKLDPSGKTIEQVPTRRGRDDISLIKRDNSWLFANGVRLD